MSWPLQGSLSQRLFENGDTLAKKCCTMTKVF